MKTKSVRLRNSTIKYIEKLAQAEDVKPTTMIRLILEREEFKEKIKKELEK